MKEFVTCSPVIQEVLKEVFQAERKWHKTVT